MEEISVKIMRMPGNDDMPLPKYMTVNSAGMDVCAAVPSEIEIKPGERKAQMVVQKVARAQWVLRESLDETIRGSGGFGHTGFRGVEG